MDYDKLIAELEYEASRAPADEVISLCNRTAAAIRELMAACKGTTVSCVCGGPLGDAQTTTEQLSEQIEELKADSIRIRKAIEQHREQMKRHGHHVPSPIDAMLYAALKSDKAAK